MRNLIVLVSGAAVLAYTATLGPAREPNPASVRIGVLPSIFRGTESVVAAAVKEPLLLEVETQTGLDCKLELMLSLNQMQRQLSEGRIQFALCYGFEYAWMRLKATNIKPLMIAAPDHRPLKAFVVVAMNNPAKSLEDLEGSTVAIPNGSHPVVSLFAERLSPGQAKPPIQYFEKVTRPENAETALHELYDDKVQAAIVDGSALQCFAERYPARSKLIRTVIETDAFPMSVVVTGEGSVNSAVLRRFQTAMEKAHENARCRQLMRLIHTAGFEAIPADFDGQLDAFVKRYPPPEGWLQNLIR